MLARDAATHNRDVDGLAWDPAARWLCYGHEEVLPYSMSLHFHMVGLGSAI